MKLIFKDKDNKELTSITVSKAARFVSSDIRFFLESLKDGSCRLLWSSGLINEFKDVHVIEIQRDHENSNSQ